MRRANFNRLKDTDCDSPGTPSGNGRRSLGGETLNKKLVGMLIGFLFMAVAFMPSSGGAPTKGTGSSSGLTREEVQILSGLDYANAWKTLETISSMGEKVVGTAAERAGQQYVFDQLSAMKMDKVVKETFPADSWQHYGTTLKIVSNANEDVQTTTYGMSYSTWGYQDHVLYTFGNMNNGKTLVAPVTFVGTGTAAEFAAAGNLNGAIALVHRDDNVQGWPDVVVEEAQLHGASATVFYGYMAGFDLPDGIKQDSVGGPLPALSISPNSALHILDLMSAGPVILQIDGRADMVSSKFAETTNVMAYMYGTTRPNEYVVISGHMDCWWNGANDDQSSIAAMLEFARLFSTARADGSFVNERTLVFSSVGGEEMGGPHGTWYNWLVGSYELVKAHPEIMAGLAVELNMDGVSFMKTSGRYWVENTWEVNGLVGKAISDLGLTGAVGFYNPVWSWTDAWSFAAKGGGSAVQLEWAAGFDSYYHTQYDTMPQQSMATLSWVLQLHTLLAIRATHAFILPIEFQYTVDWAAGLLKTEKMSIPSEAANIDKDLTALSSLRTQAVAANTYGATLTAQYAAAKNAAQKKVIWDKANAFDKALIDARRIITPWTLGEGGAMGSWDVFLRSEQNAHDLGFLNKAIAALEKGQTGIATVTLESVYTMDWGKYFSRAVYVSIYDQMMPGTSYMYWGGDFDQQQKYIDVQGVYLGLKDGSLSDAGALATLTSIRSSQLVPWYETALGAQASAWTSGAGILDAAVP